MKENLNNENTETFIETEVNDSDFEYSMMAYPIYILTEKEKQIITIPDFSMGYEMELGSLAKTMQKARAVIEVKLKELQNDNKKLPKPNTVEYKKKKNEIFTYIDVNPNRFNLETSDTIEARRIDQMWDVKENVIEFLLGEKEMTLTLTKRKLINKVITLSKDFPEEVKVLKINNDGSIYAKMPTSYLKLNRPFRRELTEEEKERNREHLAKGREQKKINEQKEKRD